MYRRPQNDLFGFAQALSACSVARCVGRSAALAPTALRVAGSSVLAGLVVRTPVGGHERSSRVRMSAAVVPVIPVINEIPETCGEEEVSGVREFFEVPVVPVTEGYRTLCRRGA